MAASLMVEEPPAGNPKPYFFSLLLFPSAGQVSEPSNKHVLGTSREDSRLLFAVVRRASSDYVQPRGLTDIFISHLRPLGISP